MIRATLRWSRACALGLAVLLTACASGPPFEPADPDPDTALLYLYRPSSIVGGGNHYLAAVNGTPIARLKSGTYFALRQKPGPVVITVKAASPFGFGLGALVGAVDGYVETDRFEVRAGSRYFVTFPEGRRTVDEAEAVGEMGGLELVPQLKPE